MKVQTQQTNNTQTLEIASWPENPLKPGPIPNFLTIEKKKKLEPSLKTSFHQWPENPYGTHYSVNKPMSQTSK